MHPPADGIVLFAHGSRDPEWAAPFQRLKAMVEHARPGTRVELAFLEMMTPSLEEAVQLLAARGARAIVVAPLFLAAGGHVKRDLPARVAALAGSGPALEIRVLPTVGEVDAVLAAIGRWIVEAS